MVSRTTIPLYKVIEREYASLRWHINKVENLRNKAFRSIFDDLSQGHFGSAARNFRKFLGEQWDLLKSRTEYLKLTLLHFIAGHKAQLVMSADTFRECGRLRFYEKPKMAVAVTGISDNITLNLPGVGALSLRLKPSAISVEPNKNYDVIHSPLRLRVEASAAGFSWGKNIDTKTSYAIKAGKDYPTGGPFYPYWDGQLKFTNVVWKTLYGKGNAYNHPFEIKKYNDLTKVPTEDFFKIKLKK